MKRILFLMALCAATLCASATIRYVSPSGDNNNDGKRPSMEDYKNLIKWAYTKKDNDLEIIPGGPYEEKSEPIKDINLVFYWKSIREILNSFAKFYKEGKNKRLVPDCQIFARLHRADVYRRYDHPELRLRRRGWRRIHSR